MFGLIAELLGKTVKASVDLVDDVIEDVMSIPDAFSKGYSSEEEPKEADGVTPSPKEETKSSFTKEG